MRAFLWIAGIVLVLVAAGAWFGRSLIVFEIAKSRMMPHGPFSEASAPTPPDYSDPKFWAALPDSADAADFTIPGKTEDHQKDAPVDVFFVHPTTYLKKDHWNAPLDDPDANAFVDGRVLAGQASVFNGCCKIYAPRYRQATFMSYVDDKGNGAKALDLAYRDVLAAFDYYMAHYNNGRPFILAGHSQGSGHLLRLIEEHVTGTEAAKRMIAAYVIGWGVDKAELAKRAPDVPVCESAEQTGCLVSWNTFGADARPIWREDPSGNVCVNPLNWKTDGAHADASANDGALYSRSIVPQAADAQCIKGRLVVADFRAGGLKAAVDRSAISLGRGVYHIIDYGLFYMNLRENAVARVAHALLADGPAPSSSPSQTPAPAHP